MLLKPKGERNNLTVISDLEPLKSLVDKAKQNKVPIGFDSCSAPLYFECVKNDPDFDIQEVLCESCESTLFSAYINVEGRFFPCSFAEGTEGWEEGLDVLSCDDFVKDIWKHPRTIEFRNSLICQRHKVSPICRMCPIFDIYKAIA